MHKKTDLEWVVEKIETTLIWLSILGIVGGLVYAAITV